MIILISHLKGTHWEEIVFPNEIEKAKEDKWLDKFLDNIFEDDVKNAKAN